MDARVPDPSSSREFTARLDAAAADVDALLDSLLDGKILGIFRPPTSITPIVEPGTPPSAM